MKEEDIEDLKVIKEKVFKLLGELTEGKSLKEFFKEKDWGQELRQLSIKMQGNHPIKCKHCGHEKVRSKGLYKGGRRYTCNKCGKTFNDLTGTAFAGIHKMEQMMEFFETDFFNGTAVRIVSNRMELDHRTVFYWRHKLATALKFLTEEMSASIVSMVEITKKINLKGSMHKSGQRYQHDPEIDVWEWHDQRFISGVVANDLGHNSYMRIVEVGGRLDELKSAALLRRWVGERKRVVVPQGGVMKRVMGRLRRGKRRVVEAVERGGGVCDRWKNLSNARAILDVALNWGIKFHGVATKYLDNYCSIISWFVAHFDERNWFEKLLEKILLNRNVTDEYRKRKKVKVEIERPPQNNAT